MEILLSLYMVVGLILGAERLSRISEKDDSSMVCVGIICIITFWPIYLIYKLIKSILNNYD